jgi:ubiquinone/menaquinone biosynthesis C-methylase UbiE
MGTIGELRVANYLLAIEGLAMVRDFLQDPASVEPRAAEVLMIAAGVDQPPLSTMIPIDRYDVEAGYSRWAPRYDGPNPAIEAEEPLFRALVGTGDDAPGVALDAACGTGRHAGILAELGWEVVGVDRTDAMLELATAKVPGATFHAGRLEALPLEDASVDLVTCGLALTHVEDLGPVFAEFARVLRTGGRVVTTDLHPLINSLGGAAAFPIEDHRPDVARGETLTIHYVTNLVHHVSEYLAAFTAAGLRVTGCHEPRVDEAVVSFMPAFGAFPDAARQAFLGLPYLLVWELERPG